MSETEPTEEMCGNPNPQTEGEPRAQVDIVLVGARGFVDGWKARAQYETDDDLGRELAIEAFRAAEGYLR